jgi:di/tricarboxylate transporter
MSIDGWITLIVLAATLAVLVWGRLGADTVLVGALTVLLVLGVLDPAAAFAGLANPGLVTVAALYVVVAGLLDTGLVQSLGQRLLGSSDRVTGAQARLMLPATAMSAFMNNTPVVAMLVPVVEDWCRRQGMSVSRLLLPLSYAAILGGTCTLIGTSTNLVVNGLLVAAEGSASLGFFEIAWVGLPSAVAGIAYVLLFSRWLLPERRPPLTSPDNSREYVMEMLVEPANGIVGRSIRDAGLRRLPGAYLAEIIRAGSVIAAVSPLEKLQAGDRLVFVGSVDSVVDLVKMKGLTPAPEQLFKLDIPRPERRLVEVVVSPTSPVVGRSIRAGRFRSIYGAVVIGVARNGERISGKIGDIVLRPGDTLLLEARPTFLRQQRNSRDFLLVSEIRGAATPRHERAWLAGGILLGMVICAATGVLELLEAALVGAGLMLLTRCTSGASARARIDWQVLVVIGASIGLGRAMTDSGAAAAVAGAALALARHDPWLTLVMLYLITSLFTEMITNTAAAVLMFPIAAVAAEAMGVSLLPFAIAIMMAASASFATPIGYQTNLMVYGPGGYRFADYLRFGVPLNLLLAVVSVLVIPAVWSF